VQAQTRIVPPDGSLKPNWRILKWFRALAAPETDALWSSCLERGKILIVLSHWTNKKKSMQKVRDFMYMFAWALAVQVIGADLGIISPKAVWIKYSISTCMGLVNAFYTGPLQRKRQAQIELQNNKE
jgi:hypothetical protein